MTINEIVGTLKIAAAEVEWNYPLNYAEALEEAAKELSARRRISVKERLPKCDDTILLYYGAVDIGIYFEDKFRMFDKNGYPFEVRYVTHWMPLPEPPEEDDCGS